MPLSSITTESLCSLVPEEIKRGGGELRIRQSLLDKKFSLTDLLGQIEKEEDLKVHLPVAQEIVKEFLVNEKLVEQKATFENLKSDCNELHVVLAAAMEEHKSDRNRARLKTQAEESLAKHLEKRDTIAIGPKRFAHGGTKKITIHNPEIPNPFNKKDVKKP